MKTRFLPPTTTPFASPSPMPTETTARSTLIDSIYEAQITAMHGIRLDAAHCGRVGNLWKVDERYGKGMFWYYSINSLITVTAFDLVFEDYCSFSCETPELFYFGFYNDKMLSYHGIPENHAKHTLLGCSWGGRPYAQTVKPHEHLDVVSVIMLTPAIQNLSHQCNCDPLVLARVISSLDGTKEVFGLCTVFEEIKRARPSNITAAAYYGAKVSEALALLLDWSLKNKDVMKPAIRSVDHTALNLVRTHLRDNLERSVSTAELCHIACMSASKLTRLFKQVEGSTPQGYARRLRMERACELIEQSDLSMSEVSKALGFLRQGSFSEAFKDTFGITPLEFRSLRHNNYS